MSQVVAFYNNKLVISPKSLNPFIIFIDVFESETDSNRHVPQLSLSISSTIELILSNLYYIQHLCAEQNHLEAIHHITQHQAEERREIVCVCVCLCV